MTLEELMKSLYYENIKDEELVEKLKKLVKNGVTAKDIDNVRYNNEIENDTFLCLVIKKYYIDTFKFLINLGCDVNLKGLYGCTPLMYAVGSSFVYFLLPYKPDINLKNAFGLTALMIACKWNYESTVELLLKNNADVTIKDDIGKTAYDYAKERKHNSICKMLERYKDERMDIDVKSEEEINTAVNKLAMKLRGI